MATSSSPIAKSSRFPLWAKLLLGVVVALIVIALALPYFVNVDHYRDDIANALAKQTGRKVTLGPIHARLFPGAGVSVTNLHIGNPAGFPEGDLVGADEIRVNVALAPLLHGTIHVNSVELVRPKLIVLTDAAEKNNYTFTPSEPPAPKSADSSSVSLDQIDSINLTGAEVVMGSVIKGAAAPLVDTKGINVTLHNFAVSPMRMHDWQAESNLSGVTLSLSGWKDPIAFHTGKFTLSGGKVDAQFVADLATSADIKGTLSIPDFEHPEVNFEMSSSQLDVDKLIEVVGSGSGIPSAPTPEKVASQTPEKAPARPGAKSTTVTPPVATSASAPASAGEPKSELVARGHINIEKILQKPYSVGPANVEIRVFTDRAELWPISIGMYGGTLQLSSRVDRVTNPARFTANVQIRNLDVAKVLDVSPSARGKMGGTGELDLQLLGNLSDAWKKTLSGSGKFAVRNGHLPGVNLAGAAESVAKMAGVGGDTPFSILQGDIDIADQRVSSKQIHLDSSAGIVDLVGSLGMDGTLSYQGGAVVNPAAALGAGKAGSVVGGVVGGLLGSRVGKITVPFALGGTVESPKVTPGKGVPSFGAPATSTGTTPPTPAGQQPSVQDDVNTLRNLFKKKK